MKTIKVYEMNWWSPAKIKMKIIKKDIYNEKKYKSRKRMYRGFTK